MATNTAPGKTHLVKRADQWAVFASPVRVEIIEFMESLGTTSIAELARHMGRPADSLYHHMRKLLSVGILKQASWRKAGRQTEALYELIAPKIMFDYDPQTGRNARHFQRLTSAILRNADRKFKAATESGNAVMKGKRKNLWVRQETLHLSDRALREINTRLTEIQQILDDERSKPNGRLHTYTMLLAPTVEKSTSRNGDRKGAKRTSPSTRTTRKET